MALTALADTPEGQVETILCEDGRLSRFATPRLPIRPCGTGDLLTGLIAAHLAKGTAIEAAVRLSVETVFAVLVLVWIGGRVNLTWSLLALAALVVLLALVVPVTLRVLLALVTGLH